MIKKKVILENIPRFRKRRQWAKMLLVLLIVVLTPACMTDSPDDCGGKSEAGQAAIDTGMEDTKTSKTLEAETSTKELPALKVDLENVDAAYLNDLTAEEKKDGTTSATIQTRSDNISAEDGPNKTRAEATGEPYTTKEIEVMVETSVGYTTEKSADNTTQESTEHYTGTEGITESYLNDKSKEVNCVFLDEPQAPFMLAATSEESEFWEDDQYIYFFSSGGARSTDPGDSRTLYSEFVVVKYSDGSCENVMYALQKGHISIEDVMAYADVINAYRFIK